MKLTESQLVYQVMRELGRYGAVFRTNAGRYYTKSGAHVSGLPKGFTDILFFRPDGQACFIECKLPGGKPTPEQAAFIARMQSYGSLAGVAYNVNEALAICGLLEHSEA